MNLFSLGRSLHQGDCSCSDHVSKISRLGKCKKITRHAMCYVNEPTTCSDALPSVTDPDKKYSYQACGGR